MNICVNRYCERNVFADDLCGGCRDTARRYGISYKTYIELMTATKCQVCDLPFGKDRKGVIDHHHGTKKVRGLLCYACNTGLGLFKDNPALLREAANYLITGGTT